ncbi:MAG: class I SAM-dependent methyltransferase [Synechococcus sp.]
MVERFEVAGGRMSFRRFMELALHDPDHGAYGSGSLRVGPLGDFVTSPSMGPDFAALLAVQLVQWFDQIHAKAPAAPLTLLEVGPGEGDLAADLWAEFQRLNPRWFSQLTLVLVDCNPGMTSRQRQRLASIAPGQLRWSTLEQLATNPIRGVVVAHEVLDAFPVERLVLRDGNLQQMGVSLVSASDGQPWLQWDAQPLPDALQHQLTWAQQSCGVVLPPAQAPDGWTTEWHSEVAPWLAKAAEAVAEGVVVIVDYAHAADRYYSARRCEGTLLAYRQQQASADLLADAGCCDLTAHLCLDTLLAQAQEQGWHVLGQCRQGEALLALGLGERLHSLQQLPALALAQALQRREALLRLVDPAGLGDFRWIALSRAVQNTGDACGNQGSDKFVSGRPLISRCFQEPQGLS